MLEGKDRDISSSTSEAMCAGVKSGFPKFARESSVLMLAPATWKAMLLPRDRIPVVGVRRVRDQSFRLTRLRSCSCERRGGEVRRESCVVGGERPRRAPEGESVKVCEWEGEHMGKVMLTAFGAWPGICVKWKRSVGCWHRGCTRSLFGMWDCTKALYCEPFPLVVVEM